MLISVAGAMLSGTRLEYLMVTGATLVSTKAIVVANYPRKPKLHCSEIATGSGLLKSQVAGSRSTNAGGSKARWRLKTDECGQTLVLMAMMMVPMLAMTALVVDVGHAYLCHRELQAGCDAAALAGAASIPTSQTASAVQAIATKFSSATGANNVFKNLPAVTMVSGYPQLKCLTTMQALGISCVGYLPYNAVQVKQYTKIPTYFAKLIGYPTFTIGASSTAVKGGGPSRPYNIAIIIDTTPSMNAADANCGSTQIACALSGMQVLLQYLDPCGTSQATCTITSGNSANSVVRVSLFTFPQMTYPTVTYDSQCGSSVATATTYTFPTPGATSYAPGTASTSVTYQVTGFQSDYRLSDTSTTLNQTSLLTIAAGGATGCSGMGPPSNAGSYRTYYAATMYAAQAALVQEQVANPGSQNVMIILGDGDANAKSTAMSSAATATGSYPSYLGQCSQSITAANQATVAGTVVYTVAYGSPPIGCAYDQDAAFLPKANTSAYPNISPCNEMAAMASHPWTFFSDYELTGTGSTCLAAQTEVALNDIFLQIAGDLTVARLISDTAT